MEGLSDHEQWAILRFADGPPPALPGATENEVREQVAFLAGTLKAPRTSLEGGKIKLGAYRLALTGIPRAALEHAISTAIRTLQWLPTPAELIALADTYLAPEKLAHDHAIRLARDHRQALFEATLRALRDRSIPEDELASLNPRTASVAATQGSIIILKDGSRRYRTPETIALHQAELRELIAGIAPDERDKRAGDGPVMGEKAGSVGKVAADLLAGMEVSDGEA